MPLLPLKVGDVVTEVEPRDVLMGIEDFDLVEDIPVVVVIDEVATALDLVVTEAEPGDLLIATDDFDLFEDNPVVVVIDDAATVLDFANNDVAVDISEVPLDKYLLVVVVVTAGVTLPESEATGTVVISCDEDLEGVVVNKDVVPVDDVPVGDDTFANVDVIADRGNPVGSDVDSVADGTVADIVDAEVYDGSVEDVVVEVVVVVVVLPKMFHT